MLFGLSVQKRYITLVVAAAGALALLTVYCQIWSGEEGVSLNLSIGWALVTLSSWIAFATYLWCSRVVLIGRVEGGGPGDVLKAAGTVFAVTVAIALVSTVLFAGLRGEQLLPISLVRRLFSLSPVLLLLSVAVTGVLAAWRWRRRLTISERLEPAVRQSPDSLPPEWLDIPEAPRLRLRQHDVSVIRTARNYCELCVDGRAFLVRVTARELEQRLAPFDFVRVHRSAIVNFARVRMIQPDRSGRVSVLLDDGSKLPVSRAYAKQLNTRMPTITSVG